MAVARMHVTGPGDPVLASIWESGFTGNVSNSVLKQHSMASLVETIMRADQSTLQELSVIFSGLVLMHVHKSSHLLIFARRVQQMISGTAPSRRVSASSSKSAASRALGLSLHYSFITANKITPQSQLVASIFGAQSALGASGAGDMAGTAGASAVHNLAYAMPNHVAADLLGRNIDSDSVLSSKDNLLLSFAGHSNDDGYESMGAEELLLGQLNDNMDIRAMEGEVVRDASGIGLQDLGNTQNTLDASGQKLSQSQNPFEVSGIGFSDASKRLTGRLLSDVSNQSAVSNVVVREVKPSARAKAGTAQGSGHGKTGLPATLFDKQTRLTTAMQQKNSYSPKNRRMASVVDHIVQLPVCMGHHRPTDLTFNFAEPEFQTLVTAMSQQWSATPKHSAEHNDQGEDEPHLQVGPPENYIGDSGYNNDTHQLLDSNFPDYDQPAAYGQHTHSDQISSSDSELFLLTTLRSAPTPLSITQLASSSRTLAASMFASALALRASGRVTITQQRTASFQRDVYLAIAT